MTCENLATAGAQLEAAAEHVSETGVETTLSDVAEQLDTLAGSEQGPDHGRLARIEASLRDLEDEAGTDVTTAIEDSLDEIHDCRETLEGV